MARGHPLGFSCTSWHCRACLCHRSLNPHEKVNGLWLVVAAACIYVLAFRFYGRWLATSVVQLDDTRITPAIRLNDGVNFHPTNKYVMFGHHFAAIAGAGPLLGPVWRRSSDFFPGFSGW